MKELIYFEDTLLMLLAGDKSESGVTTEGLSLSGLCESVSNCVVARMRKEVAGRRYYGDWKSIGFTGLDGISIY